MWEPGAPGHYWTGTLDDGVTINKQTIPLDSQAWALLAFGPNDRTREAIAYAESHHRTSWGGYDGFDFNDDRDMPWPEGTAEMVVGYSLLADGTNAPYFLAQLRAIQATATHGNGKGIVAAPAEGLTTGFDWEYFNRLHVGATGRFIAGERGCNLYWSACRPEYSEHIYLPLVRM